MRASLFQALAAAASRREPVALAIITAVQGSSPQKLGAKALFFADGRILGTVGGGSLEAEIQRRALRALETGPSEVFELLLSEDHGWDDALRCGGRVRGVILPHAAAAGAALWPELAARARPVTWGVKKDFTLARVPSETVPADWLYQETVRPPCALWVAGAGHIARAVAPLAVQLDFAVTVFDDRPALASREWFPAEVTLRVNSDWAALLAEPWPPTPAFGLIVTRGHRHDALVLRHWIGKPFAFLGMIGSRRKARAMAEQFLAERLATAEQMAQVACPVGLPIGAVSVEEIAVSIAAQLVERRAALRAGPPAG